MEHRTTRWAALVAAGALALTGCSGTGTSDDGAGAGSAAEPALQDERAEDAASGQVEALDPDGTHTAHTAALTTTVEDVARASAQVRSTAESLGGLVSSEETHIAPDGANGSDHSWAQIVVTVPVDEFDTAMTRLARIGEVTSRTDDVQDLSQQYTDTTSRIRTLRKSVARLQELIDLAADLKEIVALESELTQREADLESMVSQQKALEKRTSTAPITLHLTSPEAAASDPDGFLAGLASGWQAFTAALAAGLTALGVVTPFAVTGVVLAAPLVWWLRRRLPRVSPAGLTASDHGVSER